MLAPVDSSPFGAFAPSPRLERILRATRAMPESWLGRRLAYALRRLGLRNLKGPVDVETLGARFRLHPHDNICEKRILFTPQYFDPQERAILAARITPGFVFVDIGANIGAYTLFVAALSDSSARILAIEPQPEIFDRLTTNIRQNAAHMVKAIACAVADREGEMTLFLDSRNRGEAGVKFVRPHDREAGAATVPATTLAALVEREGLGHIDAMKIDVEGAEDLILEPFLLRADRAVWPQLLILENGEQRWQMNLLGLLETSGYRLTARTRLNLVFELAES